MIKFIKHHINSILWALVILILCGAPSSGFPKIGFLNIPHLDKIVHFGLYFIFTLLLVSEHNPLRCKQNVTKQSLIVGFSVAVIYGLLIEMLQWLVFTSRSAEFFDFLANTVGATLAILVYRLVNRYSKGWF
ncbi:MAG: VanZ family protein [Bacteroidales bacterium]